MELKRQMGFGSYQTAWSWLHKIRRAMVRPDREPLSERVEADETYVGGPKPRRQVRSRVGGGGAQVVRLVAVAGGVEAGSDPPDSSRRRRIFSLRP